MNGKMTIKRMALAAVGLALAGGLAIASGTSGSGFGLFEDSASGLGTGASSSGYRDIAANSNIQGGAGTSTSGFASYTGPVSPGVPGATSVEDWQHFTE